MSCTRMLLTVLMDGIKDAAMWMDYADKAKSADRNDMEMWFRNHAKKRTESLKSDYDYIKDWLMFDDKIRSGDEIMAALKDYIDSQISDLERRTEAA